MMHMKFHEDVIGFRGSSYCPLITLISMNVSVQSHNLVTNGWKFMRLILNIYDCGVVMHKDVFKKTEELLPFDNLNVNELFCPQP